MNTILDIIGELMLFGSIGLLIWGAMLTLGQLFQSERRRKARRVAAARGDDAHGDARHAGLTAVAVAAALAMASPDAPAQSAVGRDFAHGMEAIDAYDYAGAIEPLRSAGDSPLTPRRQAGFTSSMILPMCCELSISSCAARASASGKVL